LSSSQRERLVASLEAAGVIRTAAVRNAILSVPRELFVWEGYENMAYADSPLPLGSTGQTISAPHMVAIMLEELDLEEGHTVLEVGCGSGYNAACISRIVGSRGRVVSVELNGELVQFSRRNLSRAGITNVEVEQGDGSLGFPPMSGEEMYDRIAVTAAARRLPEQFVKQLKKGGLILIPLGEGPVQVLTKVRKGSDGRLSFRSVCDCVFVPLIGRAA